MNNIKLIKKISLLKNFKLFYPSTVGVISYKKYNFFKNYHYYLHKQEIENFIKKEIEYYHIYRIPNVYGPNMRNIFRIKQILSNIKKKQILTLKKNPATIEIIFFCRIF